MDDPYLVVWCRARGNLGEILWLEMGGPFGIHKLG